MISFAMAFRQDQMLVSTTAVAGNTLQLLKHGVFAVSRRWNDVLQREPACWRHVRLHGATDDSVYSLLVFTKSALSSYGRYHFQHIHFDGGDVTDAGIEALAKKCPLLTHITFGLVQAGHGCGHRSIVQELYVIYTRKLGGRPAGHRCRHRDIGQELYISDKPSLVLPREGDGCGHRSLG